MSSQPRIIRSYDVVALSVPIVYNDRGDYDPNGMLYTLRENADTLKHLADHFFGRVEPHSGLDPTRPHPLVRPLVLRACQGETVRIHFENQLRQPASIHLQSNGYDVNRSDGAAVGFNRNTTVMPGQSTIYEWQVNAEGVFLFHDMANLSGGEDGTNVHGLFGTLIVEPAGATWTHPESGEPLVDGLYADVHAPGHPSFREYAVFFHDEVEILPGAGHNGMHAGEGHAGSADEHPPDSDHSPMPISYRAEPLENRLQELERLGIRDLFNGEEQHHSSWLFGDPATPILRAYRRDPAKIRLVHAGVKETHVFHLHVHQWLAVPENPVGSAPPDNYKTQILDSISISPQTGVTIEPLYGAGSRQGTAGDVIWHCHLYPHFHRGMWGMWRVHDVLEEGTWQVDGENKPRLYPDGTPIAPLKPLPDREPPPRPTQLHPGFPLYIDGKFREKSPLPPWPLESPIPPEMAYKPPTDLEKANFIENPQLGSTFVRIGEKAEPDRCYNIVVLSTDVIYNNNGWHDRNGHMFVLAEDEEDICSGKKQPEPLFIRANAGEIIELRLTNKLPPEFGEDCFDVRQLTVECGLHVHLVKFDPIVADGSSVGWNYLSGVPRDKTMVYRWWADKEFGTVFFHDHLLADYRQKHGLFAGLIVEPEGSKHLSPQTLEPLPFSHGTQAVIQPRNGEAYREFCLAVADFIPLYDKQGEALNPPSRPGGHDDPGVMGVNYRCEPLILRDGDPAHWFSSHVHGDPATPIFPTYPGDRIRIRLLQGSHEEQHSFLIHGLRWLRWWQDPQSPLQNQQTIGISEAFTLDIQDDYGAGDYLWLFGASDDLWLGCWGLIRAYETRSMNLPPLPGRSENLTVAEMPPVPEAANVRRFHVVARQREIFYQDLKLTDPYGLVYELEGQLLPEPLVLRCRAGEWVEVTLTNQLPVALSPEPNPPELPLERDRDRRCRVIDGCVTNIDNRQDEHDRHYRRRVSNRVSLHANLLRYDVRHSDGTYVGKNPDQTIGPGESIVYRWHADQELGAVLLQDMADFRNHRHHGLIGALVVEPSDATPFHPLTQRPCWHGTGAIVQRPGQSPVRELVLLMQDGLRLFFKGNEQKPVPDPEDGELDAEDQGQKGFNYRCEPLQKSRGMRIPYPATPLWQVNSGDELWLRLVVAADKPRNHSFTVHGHLWLDQPHLQELSPVTGAVGALSTGSVQNLCFVAGQSGDYAYRTGILRWMLQQGLWGILRVLPK